MSDIKELANIIAGEYNAKSVLPVLVRGGDFGPNVPNPVVEPAPNHVFVGVFLNAYPGSAVPGQNFLFETVTITFAGRVYGDLPVVPGQVYVFDSAVCKFDYFAFVGYRITY